MNAQEIITLEYSTSQKCFHRSSLADVLEKNLTSVAMDRPSDYLLIGIFDTHTECDTMAQQLAAILQKERPIQLSNITVAQLLRSCVNTGSKN